MPCRDDIIDCIARRFNDVEFSPMDIILALHEEGTHYPDTTIRTHVTSYMCENAPQNHGVQHGDIIRTRRGCYRRNW